MSEHRPTLEYVGGPLQGRPAGQRLTAGGIWLAFIILPVVTAATNANDVAGRILTIAGSLVFVAAYVAAVLSWRITLRGDNRRSLALLSAMVVSATALCLADQPGWGYLFIYTAACSALLSATGLSFAWLVFAAVCAGGIPALAGGSASQSLSFACSAAGVGLLMMLVRDLRLRNLELTDARAELARTAVIEERERFARDLHDLLGHTLSVIAIKAELAGRLLPEQAERAADEVRDIETVARQALGDVRGAVSGYRRPTLEGEIAGARMALAAAGIEADVRGADVKLGEDVEAVLAWAVREGATNVIRHSAARRCMLKVTAALGEASVEVVDDGDVGARTNGFGDDGTAGNGLSGLRERVVAVHGTVAAGPQAGGGFRLAVTVPWAELRT